MQALEQTSNDRINQVVAAWNAQRKQKNQTAALPIDVDAAYATILVSVRGDDLCAASEDLEALASANARLLNSSSTAIGQCLARQVSLLEILMLSYLAKAEALPPSDLEDKTLLLGAAMRVQKALLASLGALHKVQTDALVTL